MSEKSKGKPILLAPAGNKASFLAAIAAGADAVYCGLPQFSARMMAKNFSIKDLAGLTQLAHSKSVKVYIAMNSLIKTDELDSAGKSIDLLKKYVKPDGLIIQDIGVIPLIKKVGFKGEVHLSTLTNVSFPSALPYISENFDVQCVVVPRELHVDEIKQMDQACGSQLKIEAFIHGALCYGVSGRCYWSSFLGGKSGLRGHCVQPCRRVYKHTSGKKRFFSCKDFSVDVLIKVLSGIENLKTLKIEGRKKSAWYVYNTVTAYKMLRDEGKDPKRKKEALFILGESLGRPGSHYNLLPQRPQSPVDVNEHTGSGLFIGNMRGSHFKPYISPRKPLFKGDVLRIGYEDESSHQRIVISKSVPKQGKFYINKKMSKHSVRETSVFLVDRRDDELTEHLKALEAELENYPGPAISPSSFSLSLPSHRKRNKRVLEMDVFRQSPSKMNASLNGLWLSEKNIQYTHKRGFSKIWWWLSPSIWPDTESANVEMIRSAIKKGARTFVLNAPWQISLFKSFQDLSFWAGPYCNVMNPNSIQVLKSMGFQGVIVSPELGKEDYAVLSAHSTLPLGMIVSGIWPFCVSRALSSDITLDVPFESPKGEAAWVSKGNHNYWVFPNWKLDITDKMTHLKQLGFEVFIHLKERVPKSIQLKRRPGIFNWNCGLR